MSDDQIRSIHKFRRAARSQERELQSIIDDGTLGEKAQNGIPTWARGVKVERAGFFQHAVIFTKNKGH